jgi:hypothetical protein
MTTGIVRRGEGEKRYTARGGVMLFKAARYGMEAV